MSCSVGDTFRVELGTIAAQSPDILALEPSKSSLMWDIVVRALVLISKISPFKPGVDATPCYLPEGTGHTQVPEKSPQCRDGMSQGT